MHLGLLAMGVLLSCACASASTRVSPEARMHASRWDEALADLGAHERAAADRGDARARAAALVAMSRVLLDEGLNRRAEVARALEPAERARSLAEAIPDGGLVADALDRLGMVRYWQWALADPGASNEPLLAASALFERARRLRRDGLGLGYSHFHLGLIAEGQEQASAARDHFARALALAGRDDKLASYALRHLASHDEAVGRRDVAEKRLRRSLELRRALGWKTGTASGLGALGALLHRSGRSAEARTLLREAIAAARDAQSAYYATRIGLSLARLEADSGDVEAAIAVLRASRSEVAVLESAALRAEHAAMLASLMQRCPACGSAPAN
jgi:tetratricopeptide (TPR) repeat protein